MFTEIDSIKINYIDEGEGPAVLLIHGWGSSCHVWDGIIGHFKDRLRFVAPDLPGCGQSGLMSRPWDVADYARLILKFIDRLGLDNPVLVGHSHGGRIILYMAGTGLISPKKIILFGSAGVVGKKSFKSRIKIRAFKAAKRMLTLPGLKKPCAGLLKKTESKFGSADYRAASPVLRQTLVRAVNTDLCDVMPDIKASTLLIWGEKDTATPLANAHIMEKLIPDCGLCVLKGAGHYCFLERAYEAYAIIESFLLKGGRA